MAKQNQRNNSIGTKNIISKKDLKARLVSRLISKGVTSPENASDEQIFQATSLVVKDIMLDNREKFKKRIKATGAKNKHYLCMEFLVGRSLRTDTVNLGIYDNLCSVLSELGHSFDKVYACEVDPGLGNGGLGRLAACFMDSLSALDYAANGYSLLYEHGLFKQKIVDGEQIELPDEWLEHGIVRLVPRPENSVSVKFGGKLQEEWDNGVLKVQNNEYDEVKAVPYDLLIPGTTTDAVNKIRLWRARATTGSTVEYNASQSSYVKNLSANSNAEVITRQLYPKDDYDEGKLLRLSQQYF